MVERITKTAIITLLEAKEIKVIEKGGVAYLFIRDENDKLYQLKLESFGSLLE